LNKPNKIECILRALASLAAKSVDHIGATAEEVQAELASAPTPERFELVDIKLLLCMTMSDQGLVYTTIDDDHFETSHC
jgi:hypothetical protein